MGAEGFAGLPISIGDVEGLQAALDALQDQIDDLDGGGGGGGGTPVAVTSGYVTTGNVAAQNTSGAWQLLTGGPTVAAAAAVGDRVRFDWSALFERNINTFWDVAVVVSGAAVLYQASGTNTPAVEGDPGIYPDIPSFPGRPGPWSFTVEAGHLSGGLLTIGFALKSSGGGQLLASSSFPLRYVFTNYGEAP
jgi:hypothetical protein